MYFRKQNIKKKSEAKHTLKFVCWLNEVAQHISATCLCERLCNWTRVTAQYTRTVHICLRGSLYTPS